jgi:hypothetical protein
LDDVRQSEIGGATIYKRVANAGTSGGAWMANLVQYKSLSLAKSEIEFYNK